MRISFYKVSLVNLRMFRDLGVYSYYILFWLFFSLISPVFVVLLFFMQCERYSSLFYSDWPEIGK